MTCPGSQVGGIYITARSEPALAVPWLRVPLSCNLGSALDSLGVRAVGKDLGFRAITGTPRIGVAKGLHRGDSPGYRGCKNLNPKENSPGDSMEYSDTAYSVGYPGEPSESCEP